MRLVGMAAGKTRTIEIRASAVQTAYIKAPVSGRCYVHESGLDGNETAVHPDSIYAIAAEHYEYWAERLGADRATWLPGHFAENLTIAGLDESQLRVGDIIAVGDEVELIVAGPRIPCFKLAWRLAQPDSFIREFGLSGRSGVYFGVRKTGWIEAGMPVSILHREPMHPTVADLAKLALDCAHPPEQTLRLVLALPYLSKTAALVLGSLLMKVIDEGSNAALWKDWREFTITNTTDECATVKSFTLMPSDGAPLPRSRAGQFVTVQVPLSPQEPVIRPWSLSDYAENPDSLRITVKRESGGVGSSWLHDSARQGTRLMLRAPSGRFVLDRGGFLPVVLIGAGIGITPLLAMAKAHLARGADAPPLRLIHCVGSGETHPLKDELGSLAAAHPQLRLRYVYSRPGETDIQGQAFHQQGRLSVDDVIACLDDLAIALGNKLVAIPWFECDFYICGPGGFETTLTAGLAARGARRNRIFSERFHSHGDPAASPWVEESEVVFERSGLSMTWTEADGLTLLQLAERAGLAPPSGCRIGVCLSCQCQIVAGDVRYDSRPIGEISEGGALLCCAKPATSKVVLAV
jgi:ferredoxin-NADP reductase/MOSC domain-containing protein YiiM